MGSSHCRNLMAASWSSSSGLSTGVRSRLLHEGQDLEACDTQTPGFREGERLRMAVVGD